MFVFFHLVFFFLIAATDAQQDYYHFRFFALGLIWGSASLVVHTYLGIRRAWLGQPPAEFRDGIIPAIVIFAAGWAIWTLAHL